MLILFYQFFFSSSQDPAGIFELVEVVGNGTYGQVYKVSARMVLQDLVARTQHFLLIPTHTVVFLSKPRFTQR